MPTVIGTLGSSLSWIAARLDSSTSSRTRRCGHEDLNGIPGTTFFRQIFFGQALLQGMEPILQIDFGILIGICQGIIKTLIRIGLVLVWLLLCGGPLRLLLGQLLLLLLLLFVFLILVDQVLIVLLIVLHIIGLVSLHSRRVATGGWRVWWLLWWLSILVLFRCWMIQNGWCYGDGGRVSIHSTIAGRRRRSTTASLGCFVPRSIPHGGGRVRTLVRLLLLVRPHMMVLFPWQLPQRTRDQRVIVKTNDDINTLLIGLFLLSCYVVCMLCQSVVPSLLARERIRCVGRERVWSK